MARFRNGDVREFAEYLTGYSTDFTSFFTFSSLRYEIVRITKNKYGDKIINELNEYLVHPNIKHAARIYFIFASGIIKDKRLFSNIYHCWNAAEDKIKLLPATIWAMISNFDKSKKNQLTKVIDFWLKNTKELYNREGIPIYGYDEVAKELRQGYGWRQNILDSDTIEELVSWLNSNFWQEHLALDILACQDNPSVLKKLYKNSMYWNRVRHSYGSATRIPFYKCKSTFLEIYLDQSNTIETREGALYNWLHFTTKNDISDLQSVKSTKSLTNLKIAWRRITFKDDSIIPYLKKNLIKYYEERIDWIGIIPKIWDEEIKSIFFQIISDTPLNHYWIYVINDLSKTERIETLHHLWTRFNQEIDFHLSETNTSLKMISESQKKFNFQKLAAFANHLIPISIQTKNESIINNINALIAKVKPPQDLFESFDYAFVTDGKYYEHGIHLPYRSNLDLEQLDNILPFLKYIPLRNIPTLITRIIERGFYDWTFKNLHYLLPQVKQIDGSNFSPLRYFPTDQDVFNEFDDFVNSNRRVYSFGNLTKQLSFRNYNKSQIIDLLKQWYLKTPSLENFKLAVTMVGEIGTRKDATFFSDLKTEGNQKRINQLKEEMVYEVRRRSLV